MVIALFVLLNYGKPVIVDIDMKFSIYPGEYQRAVILALNFDKPLNNSDIEFIGYISKVSSKYDIPITIFLTAQDGKNYEDFITGYPALGFNITNAANFDNIDFETAGYINQPYIDIPYKYQERLIRQSKLAFRDKGIIVKGFLPPLLQANYDTILAAENNNIEFILLAVGNATEPFHPDSLIGGKMNILVYPLYQEGEIKDNGAFIFLLNKEAIKNQGNFEGFLASIPKEKTWFIKAKELNDYIRKTEEMSAELTTDYKKMESYIRFNSLINGTKIDFTTTLNPTNITAKMDNETIEPVKKEDGFYILLDEKDSYLEIKWEVVD